MTNCPLSDHEDNNPSFSIDLVNGKWRCFGCEERGSFPELIAELDGTNVTEAEFELASSSNLDATMVAIEKMLGEKEAEKRFEYLCVESFLNVFPPIAKNSRAYQYLRQTRKLTNHTIVTFNLRWGDHGKYEDRIIMPIRDVTGKLVSYAGRTVCRGVKPKTRKARSASRTLFGIYEWRRYGRDMGMPYVVLVEGEFDAMYLQQYNVPAMATMGTAILTPRQLLLLRKLKPVVVLSYDSDEAGHKATYGDGKHRIGELSILKQYFQTIVIKLPPGKDPNDLKAHEVREIYDRFIV